jgi:hypothetical protein
MNKNPTVVDLSPKKTKTSNRADLNHFYIIMALLASCVCFLPDLFEVRSKASKAGIKVRAFTDLYWVTLAAISFHFLHQIYYYMLTPWITSILSQGTSLASTQVLNPHRVIRQIFNTGYYFGVWCFGMWLAPEFDYPSCVGGKGDCDSLGKYWPNYPLNEKMRMYMIIQFGYHFHNTVHHTLQRQELANYYEMITHHVGTMISIFLSYFSNIEDWSFLVLMLHDLSDAILNFAKVTRIGKQTTLKACLGAVPLNIFWGYDRLVCMGYCYFARMYRWLLDPASVLPQHSEMWAHEKRILYFITFNLAIIYVMNIIWQYEITSISLSRFFKGKVDWVVHREGEKAASESERKSVKGLTQKQGSSTTEENK